MSREEQLEQLLRGFLQDFPTFETAKANPTALSSSAVQKLGRGKKGHWGHSTRTLLGNAWNTQVLPYLLTNAYHIGDAEAASFITVLEAEVALQRSAALASQMRSLSEDEILAAFKAQFPSLEAVRADLASLGRQIIRQARSLSSSNWYAPALSLYKPAGAKIGLWYEHVLPALLLKSGFVETPEAATALASEIQAAASMEGRKRNQLSQRNLSQDQVIAGFKAAFPSRAELADVKELGYQAVREKYEKPLPSWFNSSFTLWRSPKGSLGSWYKDVLPNLLFLAWPGEFKDMEDARALVAQVEAAWKEIKTARSAAAQRAYTEDDLVAIFKTLYPSKQACEENMLLLKERYAAEDGKKREKNWFYAAQVRYKKANGSRGNWYEQILPNLALKAGWFGTLAEAEDFGARVQKTCYAHSIELGRASKRKMSEEEVIAAFKKEFPGKPADLTLLGTGALQKTTRGVKDHWFHTAVSLYSVKGAKSNWYENVLPTLMLKSGWFETRESALEFSLQVQRACKTRGNELIAEAQRQTAARRKARGESMYHPPLAAKSREYAVVTNLFKRQRESPSFKPVNSLLELGCASELARETQGMPRVLVNSPALSGPMSPAEIARFRTATKNWGDGDLAREYADSFEYIAPYLATRVFMLHALGLAQQGKIPALAQGASFMSGPGEVYGALQDLKPALESAGVPLPHVLDVDSEPAMLALSSNPNKVQATLPDTRLAPASMDFVECSSLYQFHPKKDSTIVFETLAEAHRVLKQGAPLLLASTAKHFGPKFEEALKLMGFDIVVPANTRLKLTAATLGALTQQSDALAIKAESALRECFFLVAVKARELQPIASPEMLCFERPSSKQVPREVLSLARNSREYDRTDTDAEKTQSLEAALRVLDSLSPESHFDHARLVQTVFSKFMLDPEIQKPENKPEVLLENARRMDTEASLVSVSDPSRDMYYILLQRMTRMHLERFVQGKQAREKAVVKK